jgi:hypothetical protein
VVWENVLGPAPRGRAARIMKEKRDGLARAGRASRVGQGSIHLQMTGQPEMWRANQGTGFRTFCPSGTKQCKDRPVRQMSKDVNATPGVG